MALNRKSDTPLPPYSSGAPETQEPRCTGFAVQRLVDNAVLFHFSYFGSTSRVTKAATAARNISCSSSNNDLSMAVDYVPLQEKWALHVIHKMADNSRRRHERDIEPDIHDERVPRTGRPPAEMEWRHLLSEDDGGSAGVKRKLRFGVAAKDLVLDVVADAVEFFQGYLERVGPC